MGSVALPYMQTKPQLIFFTDFDGTITVDDSRSSLLKHTERGANILPKAMTTWFAPKALPHLSQTDRRRLTISVSGLSAARH